MQQQEALLQKLKTALPTNLLLVGPKYSGKKELVVHIAPTFYWVEGKVENIRQIEHGGDLVFADIDDWSSACYSAMLKMLEENEHHIIITCKNLANIPMSIQSRCVIEHMEPYKDIGWFCDNIGQLQFVSEEMLADADKLIYDEKYDLDVYFTVVCNKLLDQIKNGKDVRKEYLICCKYNKLKSLKSLNKKQFINNWKLELKGF